jgi:hypothetical protein
MPADIRLPFPKADQDLRLYFDESVESQFGLALDFSVAEFDELARMTGIVVSGAEATDVGVAVHYTVSWEAFHACDDKIVTGAAARFVRGKRERSGWLFEKSAPPDVRSTRDEF